MAITLNCVSLKVLALLPITFISSIGVIFQVAWGKLSPVSTDLITQTVAHSFDLMCATNQLATISFAAITMVLR